MKVGRVMVALMLWVGAGRGQYLRLPTPPVIKFGRFRPLLQALFRPPFLKSGHGPFRRPPPPLPPPMEPHFHPPVLPPIHAPMKPPPPHAFKQIGSPPRRPPSAPHEFGSPKPNSIIALKPPPMGIAGQSTSHSPHKPQQSFRAPHHLLHPFPSGLHPTSTLPNLESNLIPRPSMGKPPDASPIKKPHIVKLKPIKMIAKPHIHLPPPPSLPHSSPMPQPQGTFSHPHDAHQGSKFRPGAHQSGGHLTKPPDSILHLHESPTKGPHNSRPQNPPSNNPQSPALQNSLFIRKPPNSSRPSSSSIRPPAKIPNRPFQNDVTGHVINPVPDDVGGHVFTKVPTLNAGVLPLANEIDKQTSLYFPLEVSDWKGRRAVDGSGLGTKRKVPDVDKAKNESIFPL